MTTSEYDITRPILEMFQDIQQDITEAHLKLVLNKPDPEVTTLTRQHQRLIADLKIGLSGALTAISKLTRDFKDKEHQP